MIKNKNDSAVNLFTLKRSKIAISLLTAIAASNAVANTPAVWVQEITGGEVRFYDWGYSGPQGQNAGQWDSNGTFDGAAQIQHVITTDPDRLTPDETPAKFETEWDIIPLFREPNIDAQTNFYKWGYTTTGGSTFSNMQIDADGDYLIKREDMAFNYYNTLDYKYEGAGDPTLLPYNAPEGINETLIQFQPYALSDAKGWCGSITASNPGALEAMAGQVTFDFGFEAYLSSSPKDGEGIGIPGKGAMQIVTDFQMRSYGSLEVDVKVANGGVGNFDFKADAVVNNTNPLDSTIPDTVPLDSNGNPVQIEVPVLNMDGTPAMEADGVTPRTMMVDQKVVGGGGIDEDYYNKVSFMGGGIVPAGVWVELIDPNGDISNDNILEVLGGTFEDGSPDPTNSNVVYHQNSFAHYPFLLRADGIRILDAMDFSLYDDFSGIPAAGFDGDGNLINLEGSIVADLSVTAVPVPAAVWLFGSGLIGLLGFARRKKD